MIRPEANEVLRERMSTHWGYLDTLVNAYEGVLESSIVFSRYIKIGNNKLIRIHPIEHTKHKRDFCSKLYVLFIMCRFKFGQYLTNEDGFKADFTAVEKQIQVKDYTDLISVELDDQNIFFMFEVISYWLQKDGSFRTLIVADDPNNAIKNGGRR